MVADELHEVTLSEIKLANAFRVRLQTHLAAEPIESEIARLSPRPTILMHGTGQYRLEGSVGILPDARKLG